MTVPGVAKRGRKVFVSLFPACEDQHVAKDSCMIAYVMGRDFGYDGIVACNRNGEYPSLATETPGLKMDFIDCTGIRFFDRLIYILKNAGKIDVLQVMQFSVPSLLCGALYKKLNPKGIVYIKTDKSAEYICANPNGIGIDDFVFFSKFAHFDVISVESQEAAKLLHNNPKLQKYKDSIIYQQNGVDAMRLSEFRIPFGQKENIVLHVGRIGNWQKATDVAIEAFSRICGDFPEWRLVIVGPMNKDGPGFAPETSKRVSNLGKVPKEELFRTYAKSKILFAPSRSEGLPAAALEAGYFGTVLLGSAMNSMKNQINNNDEFGDTCPIDDVKCFASKLAALMKGGDRLKEMSAGIAKHIETNFEWHAVCAQLEEEFNRVRQK